jgi:hypothetical protein
MSKTRTEYIAKGRTVEIEQKSKEEPFSPSVSLLHPACTLIFIFGIFTFDSSWVNQSSMMSFRTVKYYYMSGIKDQNLISLD